MKINSQKGQGLIEAVVALGAAVFIISAIAVVVITAVNNSDFSKYQNLATQYSQQGMEILKQQSQSDWSTFSALSGTYCLNQSSTKLTILYGTNCAKNINNFFVRQVVINQGSVNCNSNSNREVSVSVYWTDGKCTNSSNTYCHDVTLNSCLANINSAPAP